MNANLDVAEATTLHVPTEPVSGTELILLVEDCYNRVSNRTLQKNEFWQSMVDEPLNVPDSVFHGMCIENYQLLCRESYFDAPILSFPGNRKVREQINEFYCEEIGHDRILLESLESIGLDIEQLSNSVPLQGTMGLCNALSCWSRHDPLFFLTTLGPLEGREVGIDSFILAAEMKGLPDSFVEPIRRHAQINMESEHGLLTRDIFNEIPVISQRDAKRVLSLTSLFISVYDNFYANIWKHYSSIKEGEPLLRLVTEI